METQTTATNTDRYQQVDDTLPATLPAITRDEATKAAHLICKKFGKKSLGPVTMTFNVTPYATRRCWLSPQPTRGSNHDKGWGRLIHDMSHWIFHKRHPHFRSHDGGHSTLEREIAEYVVAAGWLDGKLKPAVKTKPTIDIKLQRIEANITRWESKHRRAMNALKKLKRKHAALTRRLQTLN